MVLKGYNTTIDVYDGLCFWFLAVIYASRLQTLIDRHKMMITLG